MKNIKVDYIVKNNIFEDGEKLTIELPISESNLCLLMKDNKVANQNLENAIINIARMQGYQYADLYAIHY